MIIIFFRYNDVIQCLVYNLVIYQLVSCVVSDFGNYFYCIVMKIIIEVIDCIVCQLMGYWVIGQVLDSIIMFERNYNYFKEIQLVLYMLSIFFKMFYC